MSLVISCTIDLPFQPAPGSRDVLKRHFAEETLNYIGRLDKSQLKARYDKLRGGLSQIDTVSASNIY